MQLSPLLSIGRGVTAVIGGGGKTTLLAVLAAELRRKGSVILCTSTKIYPPAQLPILRNAAEEEAAAALAAHGAICLGEDTAEGKLAAPHLDFETLVRLADFVLVEADGSKHLPLKAHAPHEPVIPPNARRVVTVIGASAFSRPLHTVCHRAQLAASRLGVGEDELVTPALVAKLLHAEPFGDRVFINQVESAADYENAAALAAELSCPVAAGSLHKEVYLCLP